MLHDINGIRSVRSTSGREEPITYSLASRPLRLIALGPMLLGAFVNVGFRNREMKLTRQGFPATLYNLASTRSPFS
jgi:hypothetical protein